MNSAIYDALYDWHPWIAEIPQEWHQMSDEALNVMDWGKVCKLPYPVQDYFGLRIGALFAELRHKSPNQPGQFYARASAVAEAFSTRTWNYPKGAEMWKQGFLINSLRLEEIDKEAPLASNQAPHKGVVGAHIEELVGLDETFVLFDPKRIELRNTNDPATAEVSSAINLNSDISPTLEFAIYARSQIFVKTQVITPFSPAIGYELSAADFDLESRLSKVRTFQEENRFAIESKTISTQAPLSLSVFCDVEELNNRGLHTAGCNGFGVLTEEALAFMTDLRLQLFFPGCAFEVMMNPEMLSVGMTHFSLFYPLDKGPLPIPGDRSLRNELKIEIGFRLHVPLDMRKLSLIKARFLLRSQRQGHKLSV